MTDLHREFQLAVAISNLKTIKLAPKPSLGLITYKTLTKHIKQLISQENIAYKIENKGLI